MSTKKAANKAAKKAVKKAAKKAATKTAKERPIPVRVRMYRQGLGDCFLLTFDPEGDAPTHMLIDCGTLGATTTGVTLDEVVADITDTTDGHLHIVVATHEHQDHVSGFRSCMEEFRGLEVDQVWLAWTEDPDDPRARALLKYKDDLGLALSRTAQALVNNRGGNGKAKETGEAIQGVLGFAMDEGADLAAGKWAPTVDEAMSFVRDELGKETWYLEPGGAAMEEEVPGFRIFVLGPPRDDTWLKRLGDHGSGEIYGLRGLRAAVSGHANFNEEEMPFSPGFRWREDAADQAFQDALKQCYLSEDAQWRRIDGDWYKGAADLALQLDNLTNNTSVALAIQRISDGKVLLLPADAQEGHWLSWHEPSTPFTCKSGGTTRQITAEELLNQTVFYKVGHHASHNATAKGKGLELMDKKSGGGKKELVAFIPVDRQVALGRKPKGSWKMPANALYRRLLEKCDGRVVRSDIGWAADPRTTNPEVEAKLIDVAETEEWQQWKKVQDATEKDGVVQVTKTYIDYLLK